MEEEADEQYLKVRVVISYYLTNGLKIRFEVMNANLKFLVKLINMC